jgi:hypothetical protein
MRTRWLTVEKVPRFLGESSLVEIQASVPVSVKIKQTFNNVNCRVKSGEMTSQSLSGVPDGRGLS